jgi:hypothetical protein
MISASTCGRAVFSKETGGASGDPKLLFGWSGENVILYNLANATFSAAVLPSFLLRPVPSNVSESIVTDIVNLASGSQSFETDKLNPWPEFIKNGWGRHYYSELQVLETQWQILYYSYLVKLYYCCCPMDEKISSGTSKGGCEWVINHKAVCSCLQNSVRFKDASDYDLLSQIIKH